MRKLESVNPALLTVAFSMLFVTNLSNTQLIFLNKLDRDLDGQISLKEAVHHLPFLELFSSIDLDGNGKISPTELSKTKLNSIEHPTTK